MVAETGFTGEQAAAYKTPRRTVFTDAGTSRTSLDAAVVNAQVLIDMSKPTAPNQDSHVKDYRDSYHMITYGEFGVQNKALTKGAEGWPVSQDVRTQLDLGLDNIYKRIPKTSL